MDRWTVLYITDILACDCMRALRREVPILKYEFTEIQGLFHITDEVSKYNRIPNDH